MHKGLAIRIQGPHAAETARALAVRLVELGHRVEHIDAAAAKRLSTRKAAVLACELLTRNGVFTVVSAEGVNPAEPCLKAEVSPHDTPDFAADKVLDALAAGGYISLEAVDYTPEEEEQVRVRLSQLGYLE